MEGEGPSPARAHVLASLAGMRMLRGDHGRAISTAEAAIDLALAIDAPLAETHAMVTLGTSTALLGQCTTGLRILGDAFDRTQASGDVHDLGRAYACLSATLLICGALEDGLDVAQAGVSWSRVVGTYGQYGRFLASNVLDGLIGLGRWDEAEKSVDDLLAAELFGVNRIGTIAASATFLVRRGRATDAAPLLAEGNTLVAAMRDAQFTGPTNLGLAELALAQGDAGRAATIAADGFERVAATGDYYYALELAATAARAEADVSSMARARRDDETAQAAAARARHATSFLERVGRELPGDEVFGGLLASMTALASAESQRADGTADPDTWATALVAVDRARIAWPMAYTRFRLAESMLEARSPRPAAEAALADAHSAAEGLGAAPLRGWIEGLARRARVRIPEARPIGLVASAEEPVEAGPQPSVAAVALDGLGLTPRELEVLPLIAAGHTNRRIGELLFISENTAGVHVSNILGKLGVATRTEAAAIAARLGLDRDER